MPYPEPSLRNLTRRALGVLLCTGPTLLLLASFAVGLLRSNYGLHWSAFPSLLALALGSLNFYLSFKRTLRNGRHVSGFPLLGTLLVLPAATLGFSNVPAALAGLLATLIDTGGLFWFLRWTWHDTSFWVK